MGRKRTYAPPTPGCHPDRTDRVSGMCRQCYQNWWRRNSRDKANNIQRKHRLMRDYGLSLDEYNSILSRQGMRCAICRDPLDIGTDRVHVDHDHKTNKVRGVLCNLCNIALGYLRDNPDLARAAAEYLEN